MKVAFKLILILILTNVSAVALNVKPANAWTGTFVIQADGRIYPPDAPVITYDNITYTLTNNIFGSIRIQRSNIVVDGKGHVLQGPGVGGIVVEWEGFLKNVTIKKLNVNSFEVGIALTKADYCIIVDNNITDNIYGVAMYMSKGNRIYHNNFVNNAKQAFGVDSVNWWDNGYPSGGNYWSDYRGVDDKSGPSQSQPGSDGIGDTHYSFWFCSSSPPVTMLEKDNFPLMNPWSDPPTKTFNILWKNSAYSVSVSSNSTPSHFIFDQSKGQITFNLTGLPGTKGFCNVTIPKSLLKGPWTYSFEPTPTIIDIGEAENGTHSFICFTYIHESTFSVIIKGAWVIPEFPWAITLTLFLSFTLMAIIVIKRRKPKPPQTFSRTFSIIRPLSFILTVYFWRRRRHPPKRTASFIFGTSYLNLERG